MKSLRTFIAVEISAAARKKAAELIEILRAAGADVKWVEPHNLHLTLQFLGDVPETAIADVCNAVKRGAAEVEPFDLEIFGAGAFPNVGKPRTVWLGAKEGAEKMADLHDCAALALAELGFQDEDRRFQTHLTIGRVKSMKNVSLLTPLLRRYADFSAGKISVDRVIVFSSRLERGGPIYEKLAAAPLHS
ncbi:MAG: RNA 2',3'-cyclic phosphodiesterase [Pirellulales bacterium]|nr:RNA 2',3'-cyclic phosphodiesterase [Pirellulales bacterium]